VNSKIDEMLDKCVKKALGTEKLKRVHSLLDGGVSDYFNPEYDPFEDLSNRLLIASLAKSYGIIKEDLEL